MRDEGRGGGGAEGGGGGVTLKVQLDTDFWIVQSSTLIESIYRSAQQRALPVA